MREEKIYKMNELNDKRVATLYRQLMFIQTRLQAFEIVTFEMGILDILKMIFSRADLMKRVDEAQAILIQAHDKEAKESVEKEKEEARKPKISIVGANGISKLAVFVFVGVLFSGCISLKKHNRIVAQMAHENANSSALLDNCQKVAKAQENEIKAKTARLKRFSQVDENGALRPLRPWKGDKDADGWDSPNGTEPWLK